MRNNASEDVAIFWDYENCSAPSNISGYEIVKAIRRVAQLYGSTKLFKAYLEISLLESGSLTPRLLALTSELQSSGVSLIHCPHNGRKDVADKMMLVDMLAHAIDNPAPSTIVLISGDRDFAYAISVLRLRRYQVVLITLANAHLSLTSQASVCLDWSSDILGVVQPSSPSFAGKETKGTFSRSPPPVRGPTGAINPPISPLWPKSRNLPNYRETNDVDVNITNYVPARRQNNSEPYTEDDFHRAASTVHFVSVPSTPRFQGDSEVQQLSSPSVVSTPTIKVATVPDADPKTPTATPRTPSRILESRPPSSINPGILTPPPSMSFDTAGNVGADLSVFVRPNQPTFPRSPSISSAVTAVAPVTVAPPEVEKQVKIVPPQFRLLIETLESHHSKGIPRPFRSGIAVELSNKDNMIYRKAGVEKFGQYVALAERERMVELGGKDAGAWICLRPEWYGAMTVFPGKSCFNSIDMKEPQTTNRKSTTPDKLDDGFQEQLPCQLSLLDRGNSGEDALICGTTLIPPALNIAEPDRIHEESPDWKIFDDLIQTLSRLKSSEGETPLRSLVGMELVARKATVYKNAGVTNFAGYVSLAQTKGIVHLGGTGGRAWIRLNPCYAQAK